MNKISYNISPIDVDSLTKKLNNLKQSLSTAGVDIDFEFIPVNAKVKKSKVLPSNWINPVAYYKLNITIDDDQLQDDNWEIVGLVDRQLQGITIKTLWDKGVIIPEDMYKRGPDGVIECDHCHKTKAGKTQRNSAVIIHAKGTQDQPIKIDETNTERILEEGPYENYKLIGNRCIDKYTKIPAVLIDNLIKLLQTVQQASVSNVSSISLEELEKQRFSINIRLWMTICFLLIDKRNSSFNQKAIALCKKAYLDEEDVLSQFDQTSLDNAMEATNACIEAILEKTIVQKSDAFGFEQLKNVETMLKSEYIKEDDASESLLGTICGFFYASDQLPMSPEEIVAAIMTDNGLFKSCIADLRSVGTPIERNFAAKNMFGNIMIAPNAFFRDQVLRYQELINSDEVADIIASIITNADKNEFDISLFDKDRYYTDTDYRIIKHAIFDARQSINAAEQAKKYGSYKVGDKISNLRLRVIASVPWNSGKGYTVKASSDDGVLFNFPSYKRLNSDENIEIETASISDKDAFFTTGWNLSWPKLVQANTATNTNTVVKNSGDRVDVDVSKTVITTNFKDPSLKDITFEAVDGNKYRLSFFNPKYKPTAMQDFTQGVTHIKGIVKNTYHDLYLISLESYQKA